MKELPDDEEEKSPVFARLFYVFFHQLSLKIASRGKRSLVAKKHKILRQCTGILCSAKKTGFDANACVR